MSHTPGPWIYDIHEHTFYIFTKADMEMVADGDPDKPSIARMRGVGRAASSEEQEANARLIATAPELLEACKRIVATNRNPRLRDAKQRPNFQVKFYCVAKDGRYAGASLWAASSALPFRDILTCPSGQVFPS